RELARVGRWTPGGKLEVVVAGKHSHALRLDETGRLEGEHLAYEGAAGRWWSSAWRLEEDGTVHDTAPPTEGFPFLFTPAVAPDGTRYFFRVDNNRKDVSEIHRRAPNGKKELLPGGTAGFADGAAGRAGPGAHARAPV